MTAANDANSQSPTARVAQGESHRAPGSTAAQAVSGTLWNVIGQAYQQVLRMVSNVLLSRFVTPDVFGTMGLVTQLNQALYMFSDVGIGTSIVNHKKGDDLTFLRTAWSVQIVRSFVITLVGIGLAYPFAWFFSDDTHPTQMLFWITLATVGTMLVNGFQSVGLYLSTRHMKVARVLIFDLVAQTLGLGLSVLAAWQLRSVWALVIGNTLATMVRSLLSYWIVQGLSLRWCWDKASLRDLLGFGRWILLSTFLTFAANSADRFILGKLLGLTFFGLYNTAMMFALVPIELMTRITSSVIVPAYARTKDKDGRVSAPIFNRVGFMLHVVSGLLIAGVVATAPGFVRAVYREEYHAAAAIVPWLGVAAWVRTLHNNAISALLAMGMAKSTALGNGIKLAALVVLVPGGFFLMQREDSMLPGVIGACVGLTIAELCKYGVSVWDAQRQGLRPLRADLVGSLQFLLAFGVAMAGHWWMRSRGVPPAYEAFIAGTAVVVTYLPALHRGGRTVAPYMKLPGPLRRVLGV